MKKIGDVDFEMRLHTTLNTTKGAVVCRDLLSCTEEEIDTDLRLRREENIRTFLRLSRLDLQ